MSGDNWSRQELARFLRSRRARVMPEQVGLPTGGGRRTKGLRREEVAVLAGLSPTWYTYLEQGRDIKPSVQVLDSLARVLDLSEDERRYIHTLVHGQVTNPQPLDGPAWSGEVMGPLVGLMNDSEYPVYATDIHCNLTAWNRACTEWYDDWAGYCPEHRNMLRWLLVSPKAKERLPDWERVTTDVVARWRSELAKWPHDEGLTARVAEFARISPLFATLWRRHDVQEHRTITRRFRHPKRGLHTLRMALLVTPDEPMIGLVIHFPVPA
ncbi:helix-turn-helix transcriptional regulator [Actinomadura sp. ATCC 31491]|uniref:Helix-turn-helix transcriptional regulator n=1 Tax=Actinomadura luzonensis TaxID=2805427 RepID=A0ABT0G7T8_9ACTN|nr:helix-turn-helix transcriptional regulator [Actinomadura luzonensis]MCK2220656.1 helix-turn-helix transcriptional regulator [Actinomadura luzonensis]